MDLVGDRERKKEALDLTGSGSVGYWGRYSFLQ